MGLAATVYLVTNRVNGNEYVGITRFAITERWKDHVRLARRKPATHFHHAINKYGTAAFTITAIASCFRSEFASQVERIVIKQLAPVYNQTNGGEITRGKRVPREVVERIRAANIGQKRTPEQLANMSVSRKRLYEDNPELRAKCEYALAIGRKNVNQEKRIAAVKRAQVRCMASPEFRAKNVEQLNAARTLISSEAMTKCHRAAAKANKKPVECVTLNTVFDSVLEAAAATGVCFSNISRACRSARATAGGMRFRFVKGELSSQM